MSIIIYQRVVHRIIYQSMSINKYISEGCPQTNKYLCFENEFSYMENCMCEGVGDDSRNGTRHVDIQVGICMNYLNVCLVGIV